MIKESKNCVLFLTWINIGYYYPHWAPGITVIDPNAFYVISLFDYSDPRANLWNFLLQLLFIKSGTIIVSIKLDMITVVTFWYRRMLLASMSIMFFSIAVPDINVNFRYLQRWGCCPVCLFKSKIQQLTHCQLTLSEKFSECRILGFPYQATPTYDFYAFFQVYL